VIILKVNWYEARRWFVLGGNSPAEISRPNKATGLVSLPSLEQIANYYQVSGKTVRTHSAKEGWVAAREFQQAERDKTVTERLQKLQIDDLVTETKEAYIRFKSTLRLYDEQLRDKKIKVFPADALQTQKALLDIVKQASGIEEDNNDAYKDFVNNFIMKKKGD
jgi:hypothetical protein